jgi:hypothetical protein
MGFLAISSVTGAGIEDLRFALRDKLFQPDAVEAVLAPVAVIEDDLDSRYAESDL